MFTSISARYGDNVAYFVMPVVWAVEFTRGPYNYSVLLLLIYFIVRKLFSKSTLLFMSLFRLLSII